MPILRLFTDLEGRIGLRQFWLGSLAIAAILLAVAQLGPHLVGHQAAAAFLFAKALALLPCCALAAKRAADRGSAPLFGILLVCAAVLPGQMSPFLSIAWAPALETISVIAWLFALVDLGLMPGTAEDETARLHA